ncbi:MAG: heme-dependent oxidative N-demethylase family protein [Notoacmeibacter sp.]
MGVVLPVIGPAFRIGVQPLDAGEWLVVSDQLEAYRAEKSHLIATNGFEVFAAEDETESAQIETLERISAFTHSKLGFEIPPCPIDEPPLQHAARFIEDDLVLMRKGANGWRLAAGSLCFPSSWRLRDKFGHPLDVVHGTVPGFGTGTRNATIIARMFDALAIDSPVIRANWSIYPDNALHHPSSHGETSGGFDAQSPIVNQGYFRSERQTLTKLPKSGDILFTIRIGIEPLAQTIARGDAGKLAAALRQMTHAERQYKGLENAADLLAAELETTAPG